MSRDAWILIGVIVVVVGAVTLFFALRLTFKLVAIKRSLNQLGARELIPGAAALEKFNATLR